MANEKRLIDANAFFGKLKKLAELLRQGEIGEIDLNLLIASTPTMDAVEVVHGRWVMKETMIRSPFAKNAYCSVCLEETSYAHNYCPNCGAKMDGDCNV